MEDNTADELSGKRLSMSWYVHGVQPPARHPRLPWVQVRQRILRLLFGTAYIGSMVSLPPTECVRRP